MPTVLETIECMIGTTGSILVPIENPLDIDITLKSHVSNPDHFAVVPELIDLNGYEQGTFELQFRPSSLSDVEETTVTIYHPLFGEMIYIATGQGLLPGVMPIVRLYSPLGEMGSHTIMFRNPFPFPLPTDVFLTGRTSTMTTTAVSLLSFTSFTYLFQI